MTCADYALSSRICSDFGRLGPPRTASAITGDMTIKRLDHVSVVVDDLAAAIAFFFTVLGMMIEGETRVALLRLDPMARNHPAFCAAVLSGD